MVGVNVLTVDISMTNGMYDCSKHEKYDAEHSQGRKALKTRDISL